MAWATYATFCELFIDPPNDSIRMLVSTDGRRVVFLCATPCLAMASFGVSTSHSVPELLFWRGLQAAGASAGISTSMAIIGDIYKLEERGTAVGITFGVRFRRSAPRAWLER